MAAQSSAGQHREAGNRFAGHACMANSGTAWARRCPTRQPRRTPQSRTADEIDSSAALPRPRAKQRLRKDRAGGTSKSRSRGAVVVPVRVKRCVRSKTWHVHFKAPKISRRDRRVRQQPGSIFQFEDSRRMNHARDMRLRAKTPPWKRPDVKPPETTNRRS